MRRGAREGTQQAYVAGAVKRGVKAEVGNRPGLMPGGEDTFASYGALGERVEYAVPAVQALGARGRHFDAADRALAGTDQATREAHEPAGAPDRHLPTCAELAGAKAPVVEGRSLVPGLEGGTIRRTDPIYWEHEGNGRCATASGSSSPSIQGSGSCSTSARIAARLNDLAAKEAAIASRMAGLYDQWAARVGAEDWTKVQQTRPL